MNALHNANIQDENCSGLASFAFPDVQNSKTGESVRYVEAPERKWYVLRIKYGKAQVVADSMIHNGTYVYMARIWKDFIDKKSGQKHRKLIPFMNLLFAYVTENEAERYVKESVDSKYITYYYNHFTINRYGVNPPLTISSEEMEPLVRATSILDEHVMEVDIKKCRFKSDDIVRVTKGPFEGVRGRVARVYRQQRVVVYIKGLNSGLTTAYIPSHYLTKVNNV